MRTKNPLLFLLLGGLLIWGCYGSNPDEPEGNPGPNEVWVLDNFFKPTTLTVAPGDTVTWTHKGGVTHTVTSNDGLFNRTNFKPGETFKFPFDSTGTFNYRCDLHPPNMIGKIQAN